MLLFFISSDTESYPQKSVVGSSIKLDSTSLQENFTADILATPSVACANLTRIEKVKSNDDILEEDKNPSIAKLKNISDENVSLNYLDEGKLGKTEKAVVETPYDNLTTSFATKERNKIVKRNTTSCFGIKRSRKLGTGKWHLSERGLQRVQNLKQDARSKNTASPTIIVEHNLSEQTKRDLKQFAAQYVGKICELALTRKTKESCREFAKVYVENVLILARNRISELENLKRHEQNVRCEEKCSLEVEDHPSFSKVWKYSQALAEGHDFSEARTTVKDIAVNGEELGTSSDHLRGNDGDIINDCQTGDFEREIVNLASSSDDSLSENSPTSSSESVEFHTQCTRERGEPIPPCEIENEAKVHYAFENMESGKLADENYGFPLQAGKEDGNCSLEALGISSTPTKEGEELPPGKTRQGKLATRTQRTGNQPEPSCGRRRPFYKRTVSESQASERKQWNYTQPGDDDMQVTNNLNPSGWPGNTPPKFVRSTSCPDVTEASEIFDFISDSKVFIVLGVFVRNDAACLFVEVSENADGQQ